MAEAAAETRQQLELTRESLEQNVDRLVARAKHELDWKARLRRDLPQIAAIGGGMLAVTLAAVLLRRRFGKKKKDGLYIDDFSTMNFDDLAKELKAIKEELQKQREGGGSPAMKLATAALSAGAAAAGRSAASRLVASAEEERPVAA